VHHRDVDKMKHICKSIIKYDPLLQYGDDDGDHTAKVLPLLNRKMNTGDILHRVFRRLEMGVKFAISDPSYHGPYENFLRMYPQYRKQLKNAFKGKNYSDKDGIEIGIKTLMRIQYQENNGAKNEEFHGHVKQLIAKITEPDAKNVTTKD
jgi:hypothetical protein